MNEKISIIIKTYRRHNCLDRLVDSIRKYYPYISIIIADDSPGNGPTGEFLAKVFTPAVAQPLLISMLDFASFFPGKIPWIKKGGGYQTFASILGPRCECP